MKQLVVRGSETVMDICQINEQLNKNIVKLLLVTCCEEFSVYIVLGSSYRSDNVIVT